MEYKINWEGDTVKLIRFLINECILKNHIEGKDSLSLLILQEFYEEHKDRFEKALKIKKKLKRSEALVLLFWLSVVTVNEDDYWAMIERQRIVDNLHNILYGQKQTKTMQRTATQLLE